MFWNRILITNLAILVVFLQLLSFYLKGNETTDKQVNYKFIKKYFIQFIYFRLKTSKAEKSKTLI